MNMSSTVFQANEETFYHTSYTTLQNVPPTQNTYFQVATGMEAIVPSDSGQSNDSYSETDVPFLEIVVQPSDRFRFRYKSESGSHGKLRGAAKGRAKTNFPTVKLHNLGSHGRKIVIRASLYTNDPDPRRHILELVGKNCKNGECSEVLSDDNTAMFRFLEIESKKKEELIKILSEKKTGLDGEVLTEEEILKEVHDEIKSWNMNCARLCFEAFHDNVPVCGKVFSNAIINLKSTSSDLRITRLSGFAGKCSGGEDIILLCDKVNKDDIKVRFFEKNENNVEVWEDFGTFNPKFDVHHQVAIAFKTPPYRENAEGRVFINLFRPSDKQCGEEPREFCYIPDEIELRTSKKRKYDCKDLPLESIDFSQPSCSYTSSSSNISEDFMGFPGSSSSSIPSVDDIFAFNLANAGHNANSSSRIIQPTLDLLNFDFENLLEGYSAESPSSTEMYDDSACQMDAVGLLTDEHDIGAVETVQLNSASNKYNLLPGYEYLANINSEVACSGGIGFFDILTIFEYYTRMGLSKCFVGNEGSTISGNRETFSSSKEKDIKPQIDNIVESAVENARSSTKDGLNAQRHETLHHKHLSIKPSNKSDITPLHSRPVMSGAVCADMADPVYGQMADHIYGQMAGPICGEMAEPAKSRINLGDSKMGLKASEKFKHFQDGISEVLRNRKEKVYLRYIQSLLHVQDENGNFFLHFAVQEQSENLELIAMILKIAPENVNGQNRFKETPVHLATKENIWKVLFLLLAHGGNPSIKNKDGNNCFHLAAKFQHLKSMKIMLLPNLKQGKRIPSINALNYDGFAPLHLSVMNNAKECMQLLLQSGADVNIAEKKTGRSPLHLAIEQQPSLISYLVSHPDIDLESEDFRGYTPLHAACDARGMLYDDIFPRTKDKDFLAWFLRSASNETKIQKSPAEEIYDSSNTSSDYDSDIDDDDLPETKVSRANVVRNVESQTNNDMKEDNAILNEKKLCEILDANCNWRKLGELIGLDEITLNGVEKLSKNSSPARIVLGKVKKLYPEYNKETIMNLCVMADLDHVASMLENLKI